MINNNQWYHAVVTWDYTTRETQMYINNSNYSSGSTLDADASGLANLRFGIRPGATQYYQGRIDEVRIYDRVLTAGDVAVLHNSGNACQ
ncbi:LamG domain-containing protein [Hasllibacter halocynthiae]|uniref:LamG domain-containing protein n=1 Tax=Hasllibacter halocynthiae TaxID=595589 RepID=UPI000D04F297